MESVGSFPIVVSLEQAPPHCTGILEQIMEWPGGREFEALPEEADCAQEALPCNELSEDGKCDALFTDGTCHVVGNL